MRYGAKPADINETKEGKLRLPGNRKLVGTTKVKPSDRSSIGGTKKSGPWQRQSYAHRTPIKPIIRDLFKLFNERSIRIRRGVILRCCVYLLFVNCYSQLGLFVNLEYFRSIQLNVPIDSIEKKRKNSTEYTEIRVLGSKCS